MTHNPHNSSMIPPGEWVSLGNEPDELVDPTVPHAYQGFIEWSEIYTPMVDATIHAAGGRLNVTLYTYGSEPCQVEIEHCESLTSMRTLRRALGGGKWTKVYTDWSYTESKEFSPNLTVTLEAYRSSVCERVQVGTRTVTKPDREALEKLQESVKQVTVEEPVYEWRCTG